MALTATVLRRTPHSIAYSLVEDGNAAAALTQNIVDDLDSGASKDGGLHNALKPAVADQAAARVLAAERLRVTPHLRVCNAVGVALQIDWNKSGDDAGNFRAVFTTSKTDNANTGTFIVEIEYRHSLTS